MIFYDLRLLFEDMHRHIANTGEEVISADFIGHKS